MRDEGIDATTSVFEVNDEDRTVAWKFPRRKHKQYPHKLHRACVCREDEGSGLLNITPLCPYHTAKELLGRTTPGAHLFVEAGTGRPFLYSKLQNLLKALGRKMGAPNWKRFSTQGWRRGQAADRARKAKNLEEILHGGDWSEKSTAYLTYIRSAYGDVDARAAAVAFAEESEEEE